MEFIAFALAITALVWCRDLDRRVKRLEGDTEGLSLEERMTEAMRRSQ